MARSMRGVRVGLPYRAAEAILWPTMVTLTRARWQGQQHLGHHGDGIIVAPNHISWFDPIVMAYFLHQSGRAPRFMAKQSIFEVPVIKRLVAATGQIPVARGTDPSGALAAAEAALRAGECVIVYPEGTITRDPGVWPMSGRTGAVRLALSTGAPIIPVAQWGANEIMAPYQRRMALLPPKTLRCTAGPPLDLDDLRGQPVTREVLEAGTDRLMDAITALLEVIRGERAPAERLDWAAEMRRRNAHTTKEERR